MDKETENAIKDWLRNQGYESQEEVDEQFKKINIKQSKLKDNTLDNIEINSLDLIKNPLSDARNTIFNQDLKQVPTQPTEDQHKIQYINPIENNAKEILSKRRNK